MFNKSIICLFVLLLLLIGCKKKQAAEVDNETQSVLDFSSSCRAYISIISNVHQALVFTPGTGANQSKSGLTACHLLTKVSGDTLWGTLNHVNPTYSATIENMNACNSESLSPQTKNNLGQIFVTLTDKLQNIGANCIIKISGAWVKVYGEANSASVYNLCDSLILKTMSSEVNAAGFDVQLVNGKIYQDITGKLSKLNFKIKLQSYMNTLGEPYIAFYGDANGVNINNVPYQVNISQNESIMKSKACYYFKSGFANVQPLGFKNRIINYGSGNCDNDAKFEVNGNTIAFKLK